MEKFKLNVGLQPMEWETEAETFADALKMAREYAQKNVSYGAEELLSDKGNTSND
ncbi:MAG: hypothetical protein GY862_34470 [Gammaproteobacteria bacterium]|nr:hypothetical protein [Gammaproteobacteria bacterium]